VITIHLQYHQKVIITSANPPINTSPTKMMMSHQKAIRADRWPANRFFADRTPSLFRPQAHGLVTVLCLLNLQRHSTLAAAADMNRQRHLDGEETILLKEGLRLFVNAPFLT